MVIRPASLSDLPAIAGITNEVILPSTVVYSHDPISAEERRAWFEQRWNLSLRSGTGSPQRQTTQQ